MDQRGGSRCGKSSITDSGGEGAGDMGGKGVGNGSRDDIGGNFCSEGGGGDAGEADDGTGSSHSICETYSLSMCALCNGSCCMVAPMPLALYTWAPEVDVNPSATDDELARGSSRRRRSSRVGIRRNAFPVSNMMAAAAPRPGVCFFPNLVPYMVPGVSV